MRNLLLFSIILLVISCSHMTTEEKMKNKIENLEKSYYKSKGENIESFAFEKFEYKEISKRDYFEMKKLRLINQAFGKESALADNHKNEAFPTVVIGANPQDKNIEERIQDSMQPVISKADTIPDLYSVYYAARIKTDRQSAMLNKVITLQKNSLKEFKN